MTCLGTRKQKKYMYSDWAKESRRLLVMTNEQGEEKAKRNTWFSFR